MIKQSGTALDLSHLRRETRTALELAVVAMVSDALLDRLATAAGLLEALSELPAESPPSVALAPKAASRAKAALAEWAEWQKKHPTPAKA
jgi:hypothetical protein